MVTNDPDETRLNISESADKITLKTKVVRGEGTRDQDKLDVKVKGSDPEKTAARLAETLDQLARKDVAHTLRETQPRGSE
jgi:hypothetical protein